jgi:N-acetylmuramoyl-L-alanine amidase
LNHRSSSLFPHLASAATIALACLLVASLAGQPAGSALTLLSREARRNVPISLVGDQEFIALDDLASTFQLAVREEGGAVTVSYRGRTIVLTPNQALASVAGRLVSLPAPLTRTNNRWLVPVEFINRALALIYDSRLDLRRQSRLVVIGDLRVPRITAAVDNSANATRFTFDINPAAQSAISQETGRLVIRFEADALDVSLPPAASQGLVQAVRVVEPSSIAIDLGPRYASFRASTQANGNAARLVLDVLAAPVETSNPPAPGSAPTPAPSEPPASPELPVFGQPSAFRTVAIDPGHGGDDVGARGEGGAVEKDLTLAVALRVKAAIEARLGIRVLLTREDDRSIPLNERIALANNNKADVFISLHANASLVPTASGATIYIAGFEDQSQTRTTLNPERLPVFGGGSRDIELVLWDFAQIRHIDQSQELSRILEESLRERGDIDVRPIERAPFRVLESANMPAALIEMGFLTNPAQAKVLSGATFQTAFAQAVLDAIIRFRGHLAATAGEP